MKKISVLLGLMLSLVGCAMFNKFDYQTLNVELVKKPNYTVAISGVDDRSFIRTGTVSSYVGMIRNGYGVPFHVKTKSKRALVEDLSQSLAAAVKSKGSQATVVVNPSITSRSTALAALQKSEASRLLLITVARWESDTYATTEFDYAVRLEVFDQKGKKLAEASDVATHTLTGGPLMSNVQRAVLTKASMVMTKLINDPQIAANL